jgi:hypothetical protein
MATGTASQWNWMLAYKEFVVVVAEISRHITQSVAF